MNKLTKTLSLVAALCLLLVTAFTLTACGKVKEKDVVGSYYLTQVTVEVEEGKFETITKAQMEEWAKSDQLDEKTQYLVEMLGTTFKMQVELKSDKTYVMTMGEQKMAEGTWSLKDNTITIKGSNPGSDEAEEMSGKYKDGTFTITVEQVGTMVFKKK